MHKLKMVFRRAEDDSSLISKCWKIVEIPLEFVRNYTVPMAEFGDWNRNRASVLPVSFLWGFFFLWG